MISENKKVTISTVVPVYNGKDYLERLVDSLISLREMWKNQGLPIELVEVIFVNDSAIDSSLEVLESLRQKNDWLQIVTLSKNFGQHSATVAGILHTCGDWVFTIDEDLQHDPRYFLDLLLIAVSESIDVVYARPEQSVHKSFLRDQGSVQYKKLLSIITRNPHIRQFNSYRLLRGAIARAVASVCSHETYFDMALCWFTDRISTKELPLHDRRYELTKKSGYTLHRLLSHARKMLISSPAKVLRAGAVIGILANVFAVIVGLTILVLKIMAPDSIVVPGWTSTFLSVIFFGGLTSFLLSVILEYLTNILLHAHGKPSFFIVDRSSDRDVLASLKKEH